MPAPSVKFKNSRLICLAGTFGSFIMSCNVFKTVLSVPGTFLPNSNNICPVAFTFCVTCFPGEPSGNSFFILCSQVA